VTAPTFALLGAAGFVAPRHIDAIAEVGGRLVAACDTSDSVGVLDRYSRDVRFVRRQADLPPTDYVVIATPNDLHFDQALVALERGSDVICEKPVALSTGHVDALYECERRTGRRVWPVLQLRHHPRLLKVRERVRTGTWRVQIEYVAPRGPWYDEAWKGNRGRSGGVVFNLGVHLLDALVWLFGPTEHARIAHESPRAAIGDAVFPRAVVTWRLSCEDEPPARRFFLTCRETNERIQVDVSDAIGNLHVEVYRGVLARTGPTLADARAAIALCEGAVSTAARVSA
jgi:UDP-N-acetyl-2-amino-2-deoxyglucuronate dehydrogenase